tara:strand:- start:1549 stop:2730 length:1182 start_codon:yes stop_codon:yes gene_type:complete
MALNDITFIKGQGGLGRPLAGEDHISGYVQYYTNANLPSGFSSTDRIKQVFSLQEAEQLGIASGSATTGLTWYHVSEYFRIQPKGNLFIGLFDSVAIDYSVIETVQNFSDGKIRQIAVYDQIAFATANVQTLQTSYTNLEADHKPLHVLYAADFQGVATIAALSDLTTLASPNVTVVLGEDGAANGAALAISETQSITTLGATLGAVSLSAVHENIGWVQKFPMSNGTELDVPALGLSATAVLVKDQSTSALDTLRSKGYSFMRKHVGNANTFNMDSFTSTAATSDYSTIENNRTIDKATRVVRTFVLPSLNSPLTINEDGTLAEETIQNFKTAAESPLESMEIDGEVSAFEVLIDPDQNVLSTSKLVITIKIIPRGVARFIEINIGFTVALS